MSVCIAQLKLVCKPVKNVHHLLIYIAILQQYSMAVLKQMIGYRELTSVLYLLVIT